MFDKKVDLGKDNIGKLFLSFVIPAVIGMIAITTAGLVDSYFIGNYVGAIGISAITLVVPVLNIFSGIAAMIVSGGMVLAGIALGKKNKERSNNLFNVTFVMLVVVSMFMMLTIGLFGKNIIVDLVGIEGESINYVLDYLMVVNIFVPFFMLVFFFSFFLKLDGFPVIIVKATIVGVVVNMVLDYLLVGLFSYGMSGAAFATGISQLVTCFIFFMVILKKSSWKFKWPQFHFEDVKAILFNGSSEFLSLGSIGIAGYIYNIIISKSLGADGIAAYGIAMQVAGIATMVFYGISDGIQSIVSFNYGAGKLKRVDKIRNIAFISSGIIGCVFALIFIGWGKNIAGLFVEDIVIKELSSSILYFYAFATIISGVNVNASTYYTALGQPLKSAIIALMRSLIGLSVGLLIFPYLIENHGIWIPLIFTEMITLIFVVYYLKARPYGDRGVGLALQSSTK